MNDARFPPFFPIFLFLPFFFFILYFVCFSPSRRGVARTLNYTFMIVVINISRTLTSVSISQRSRSPNPSGGRWTNHREDKNMRGKNKNYKRAAAATMPPAFGRKEKRK